MERMLVVTGVLSQEGVFALKGVIVLAGVPVAKEVLSQEGGLSLPGWFCPGGGLRLFFVASLSIFYSIAPRIPPALKA